MIFIDVQTQSVHCIDTVTEDNTTQLGLHPKNGVIFVGKKRNKQKQQKQLGRGNAKKKKRQQKSKKKCNKQPKKNKKANTTYHSHTI